MAVFHFFLNNTNGTKSRKTPHICKTWIKRKIFDDSDEIENRLLLQILF